MEKFVGGKTDYTESALRKLLGKEWQDIVNDLTTIGVLSKRKSLDETIYQIPFVYRKGLDLTQGRVN